MPEQEELPSLDGLTPEEANRIIHSHRKVRYGTACWPCRQRKVKCDNKQPCENCVKRDHAQLCSYKPNRPAANKHATTTSSHDSTTLTVGKKRTHSPDSDAGRRTNRTSLEPSTESPIKVDHDTNDISRYLGQNSIPALLRDQASPNHQQDDYIRQDMRSILGLDNSAPFPLMSSRHLDKLTVDISAELPSDREVMKLFHAYKEIPHPFWGFVLDIDDLETKLMVYLEERAKNAKNARNASKPSKPVSASWLAILFSVMAVGSQYHDSPYHVRTRDSQKYMQISYHFLCLGNFLLRPNFDSIQALMMTSFVLLNDMKAEASWALLGLTTRLAQSLGLDRAQPLDGRVSPDGRKKEYLRRTLWWTIVWHDCLTSLSFDRAPMTAHTTCPIPLGNAPLDGFSYLVGMYHLNQIIGKRIISPDASSSPSYAQILDNCQVVEDIRGKMIPQLRTKDACRSAIDRLHHYAIRLHTSFVMSVCCRPALRRENNQLDADQKAFLAAKCKENLTETVRMFLAMHQLSVIPTRSWAFTYHGLSSAVLLGILGQTKADPEVRGLQGDLIEALSATAAKEQKSPPTHIHRTDRDIELSGPLSRALTALKNIYDHGTVSGNNNGNNGYNNGNGNFKKDDANAVALAAVKGLTTAANSRSGSGTPLHFGGSQSTLTDQKPPLGFPGATGAGTAAGIQSGLDPHQDAALAMAEMQNGGLDMGMFPQMQQGAGAPGAGGAAAAAAAGTDINNLDPATYLSPMDLYDQIFWGRYPVGMGIVSSGQALQLDANPAAENPEPWNMGADSMNFDFMAQPPPGQAQQQFYF